MTVVMEHIAPGALDDAVAETKAMLRIDGGGEDELIERMVRAALAHAEGFTGQVMMMRAGTAVLAASEAWTRLPVTPVRSIGALRGPARC